MENANAHVHPHWWTPTYESAWDRGKAALRRDWEQTKRDVTGGGRELNQNAGDTLKQARGLTDVPPLSVRNVPDAKDVKRSAKAADKANAVAEDRTIAATSAQAGTPKAKKLEGKAIEARSEAFEAQSSADLNTELRWEDAETAFEYGFGAGMHFAPEWSDKAKVELRTEWNHLHPDRPWGEVETLIKQGWASARLEHKA